MMMKRLTSYVLCSQFILPAPLWAQNYTIAKPEARWQHVQLQNKSFIHDNLIGDIDDVLPELADQNQANITLENDDGSLTITTIDNKSLLDWNSFNIGSSNSVEFVQPGASSVSVNRIHDQNASVIQGQLSSNGSLWLVNNNGVYFGENAKVDTRGLLASTMNIAGLEPGETLSQAQLQELDLYGAINQQKAFLTVAPSHEGYDPQQQKVLVAKGAVINSPNAPVLLAAPEVINEGEIHSDNGQVVLAASAEKVYLALSNPQDTDLRGYWVEVDSGASDARGKAINAGLITSKLGNVTMVASELIQAGKIRSTSSIDQNGSIRLLARDQAVLIDNQDATNEFDDALYVDSFDETPNTDFLALGTEAGSLTLGENSETRIDIVELETSKFSESVSGIALEGDNDQALAKQAGGLVIKGASDSLKQAPSRIIMEAKKLVIEQGSRIEATAGEISIRASNDPDRSQTPVEFGSETDASIEIGDNVLISTAGSKEAILDASRNTVEVFITSNEVKDKPEQKGGSLLRETVEVDVQRGTDLIDWQSSLASVKKSANERASQGGNIDIKTSGSLSLGDNVVLDVAGGQLNYLSGSVESSLLYSASGEIVNIAEADAEQSYQVQERSGYITVKDEKWGDLQYLVSGTGTYRVDRQAYIQGQDAGSVSLSAATMSVGDNLQLRAGSKQGYFQQLYGKLSQGGDIHIDLGANSVDYKQIDIVLDQRLAKQAQPGEQTVLSLEQSTLNDSGAANIQIKTPGLLRLSENVDLRLNGLAQSNSKQVEKGLSLRAGGLQIKGNIRSFGGDVLLEQQGNSQAGSPSGIGELVLDGKIDTSGSWFNRNPQINNATPESLVHIGAGSIDVFANQSLSLGENARLQADGGASVDEEQNITYGDAGDISLGVNFSGADESIDIAGNLAEKFSAIDHQAGGKLSLIVKNIALADDAESSLEQSNLVLNQAFFDEVAINRFDLKAKGGNVDIGRANANVELSLSNKSHVLNAQLINRVSSPDVPRNLFQRLVDQAYFQQGNELALSAQQISAGQGNGRLIAHENTVINAQAGSHFAFDADNQLVFGAQINSAGAKVDLTLNQFGQQNATLLDYLLVTDQAKFNLGADILYGPVQANGLADYRIIESGALNLTANNGYVLVQDDAQINLQGARFTTREEQAQANGVVSTYEREHAVKAGTFKLHTQSGGAMAAAVNFGDKQAGFDGGDIEIRVDPSASSVVADGNNFDIRPVDLVITNSQSSSTNDLIAGQAIASENAKKLQIKQNLLAESNLANVDIAIAKNKFDLTIGGQNIRGDDVVNRLILADDLILGASINATQSINLDLPTIDLQNQTLNLNASYVALGDRAEQSFTYAPASQGTGQLNIQSQMLDLAGDFSLQNTGLVNIEASQGVRYNATVKAPNLPEFVAGSFNTYADVNIEAPLLLGSTLADYRFNLLGDQAEFNLTHSTQAANPVLSYGAKLEVNAHNINIDSQIINPNGQISLNAANVLYLDDDAHLSVAGNDLVPFGRVNGDGTSWQYEFAPGSAIKVDADFIAKQGKKINLNGDILVADQRSVQDISAGGLVYGREFIAGLGGSNDVLQALSFDQGFVILPEHKLAYGSYDVLEYSASNGLNNSGLNKKAGQIFHVSGSELIADGSYRILPANYALLPGAILVTPHSSGVVSPDYRGRSIAGAELISAQIGHTATATQNLQNQAFMLETATAVAKKAEYKLHNFDGFNARQFSNLQPGILTIDNGGLVFDVGSSLSFAGIVKSQDLGGSSAYLDIDSANKIRLAQSASGAQNGEVFISPQLFSKLENASVLLGGKRQWNGQQWQISSRASEIDIANIDIEVDELVLSAGGDISIEQSQIDTSNTELKASSWLGEAGSTSMLISNNVNSSLDFDAANFSHDITLDSQSQITARTLGLAAKSVDGQQGLRVVDQGRFELASNAITLGSQSDFVLGNNLTALKLTAQTIDFIGDKDLNAKNIELASNQVNLADNAQVNIQAQQNLTLQALAQGNAGIEQASSNSQLQLSANTISLNGIETTNAAQKQVINANQTQLKASAGVILNNKLDVKFNGESQWQTPLVTSTKLKTQARITATDQLNIESQANADNASDLIGQSAASYFDFAAADMTIASRIVAQSGVIKLTSRQDIAIKDSAILDVSAFSQDYAGQKEAINAGQIYLAADNNLAIENTNSLDFSNQIEGYQGEFVSNAKLSLQARNIDINTMRDSSQAGLNQQQVDVSLRTDSINQAGDLDSVLALAGLGFNGVYQLQLSQAANVSVNQNASVEALEIDVRQGALVLNAGLSTTQGDLIVSAEQGLALSEAAQLNSAADLSLIAVDGELDVNSAASLIAQDDINLVTHSRNQNAAIALDDNDRIGGDINLYFAAVLQSNSLNQSDLNRTEITELMSKVNTANSADFVQTNLNNAVKKRAWLAINSDSDLSVGSNGQLNFKDLRSNEGLAGQLILNADGDINVDNALSDGIVEASLSGFFDLFFLLNTESWSFDLNAGGDINLADQAFIRTGTGDIQIRAHDLALGSNSYLASVGATDNYQTLGTFNNLINDKANPGQILNELPGFGDFSYEALAYGVFDFSGVAQNGGDINVSLRGDLSGRDEPGSSADYMITLANDDLKYRGQNGEEINFAGMRTTVLAAKHIDSGINAIGGGNINIDTAGKIEKVGFATPGQMIHTYAKREGANGNLLDAIARDENGKTQFNPIETIDGGAINVRSTGSISQASFSNDGSEVNARSYQAIGEDNADSQLLLIGSNTAMNIMANFDANFDGFINTQALPGTDAAVNFYVNGSYKDYKTNHFHNFDNTQFNFSSAAGDIRIAPSLDNVKAALGSDIGSSQKMDASYEALLAVLPSDSAFYSYQGNIFVEQNMALFPSAKANLQLLAGESILAGSELSGAGIYLPDLRPSVVRNIDSDLDGTALTKSLAFIDTFNFSTPINTPEDGRLYADNTIDRSTTEQARIIALNGNISAVNADSGNVLNIILPKPVSIYAGQDIVNLGLQVQHQQADDISSVKAGGDIVNPLNFIISGLESNFAGISVAGPGDLLVSAAGNIDLGASSGIRSVGNLYNRALGPKGANLHIYAGFKGAQNYNSFAANDIAQAQGVLADDFAEHSIVALFDLALSNTLSSGYRLKESDKEQFIDQISNINDIDYFASNRDIDTAFAKALAAYRGFDDRLQQSIAVASLSDMALRSPEFVVANGQALFAQEGFGERVFASSEDRQRAFTQYWTISNSLLALNHFYNGNQQQDFIAKAANTNLMEQSTLAQLSHAQAYYRQSDGDKQLIAAAALSSQHVAQGGVEGLQAGNNLVYFERAYVALKQFYGDDFNTALVGANNKINAILGGKNSDINEINFGLRDGQQLNNFEQVLTAWEGSSGLDFSLPQENNAASQGDIALTFSTVNSAAGGSINIHAATGSINVGLAQSQLEALNLSKTSDQLGIISLAKGEVNSVVADAFNINESRAFSLGGGQLNLWSSFGDIDAGKGAKTAVVTPATAYRISNTSGLISAISPPPVSGSGVRVFGSRFIDTGTFSPNEKFNLLRYGPGATFLSTPLGIVDAGEAGIVSAGDLFLAAQQVRGADNIDVGGVSIGIPTATSVDASVAAAGDSATSAAAGAAQESVAQAAAEAASNPTAFVTVTLIDTSDEE